MSVAFKNGVRVVGLLGKESTIRSLSAVRLVLVDEASRVEDELYRAVRPMLAVSDGTLWLLSTPFGNRLVQFLIPPELRGSKSWRRTTM